MGIVMKRAISAVVLWLAAAGTAAAADNSLAGLIQAGHRDAALKMIAAGADVNAAQGDGTTPLHWAVYKIDAELARALLARGAKPDVINKYGSSPLAEAVKVANARLVGMLLDAGSDAKVPNQEGQTALMLAARAGSLDVAELLVRHGADVNATREMARPDGADVGGGRTLSRADAVSHRPQGGRQCPRAGQRLAEPDDRRAAQPVSPHRRPDTVALCGALGMHGLRARAAGRRRGSQPAELPTV